MPVRDPLLWTTASTSPKRTAKRGFTSKLWQVQLRKVNGSALVLYGNSVTRAWLVGALRVASPGAEIVLKLQHKHESVPVLDAKQ